MHVLKLAPVTVIVFATSALPARAQDPAGQLHQLFDDQFKWRLQEFPEFAMSLGDYTNANKITDHSLEAIKRRHQDTQGFLQRLHKIDRSALTEEDQLNYDLFETLLSDDIEEHRFRLYLMPVGGRSGPQQDIPQMHERVRFQTLQDYENYLTRLEETSTMAEQILERLDIGLQQGRTPAKITLRNLPTQIRHTLEKGLKDLGEPLRRYPDSITQEQRDVLRDRFETESMLHVEDGLEDLEDYLNEFYIPKCRETIAASALPDGEAMYAQRLKHYTTTDLTAQQIHELGLREVARIRSEMMQVIRSSDFVTVGDGAALSDDNQLFKAFLQYLRTHPRFYHRTEEDLLREYRDICKRIDAELPRFFKTLPRLPYGVRKIPDFMAPNQTTAYYQEGDIRNAQPGYFYANTYALDQRPRYEMIALALHEAVPGHHFQIAVAQELPNVPAFRNHAWFTAFGEGWALYAERLGLEMNLYENPYDNFGRLLYEMWRACRLVVDPGMHALGWSREQAIQFMLDNTALSELNITNEVDRYINWPGQATAYKIGEIKIRELRALAEKELAERFDLRDFHDLVLSGGTLPLDVLESRVENWITARKVAASP